MSELHTEMIDLAWHAAELSNQAFDKIRFMRSTLAGSAEAQIAHDALSSMAAPVMLMQQSPFEEVVKAPEEPPERGMRIAEAAGFVGVAQEVDWPDQAEDKAEKAKEIIMNLRTMEDLQAFAPTAGFATQTATRSYNKLASSTASSEPIGLDFSDEALVDLYAQIRYKLFVKRTEIIDGQVRVKECINTVRLRELSLQWVEHGPDINTFGPKLQGVLIRFAENVLDLPPIELDAQFLPVIKEKMPPLGPIEDMSLDEKRELLLDEIDVQDQPPTWLATSDSLRRFARKIGYKGRQTSSFNALLESLIAVVESPSEDIARGKKVRGIEPRRLKRLLDQIDNDEIARDQLCRYTGFSGGILKRYVSALREHLGDDELTLAKPE